MTSLSSEMPRNERFFERRLARAQARADLNLALLRVVATDGGGAEAVRAALLLRPAGAAATSQRPR